MDAWLACADACLAPAQLKPRLLWPAAVCCLLQGRIFGSGTTEGLSIVIKTYKTGLGTQHLSVCPRDQSVPSPDPPIHLANVGVASAQGHLKGPAGRLGCAPALYVLEFRIPGMLVAGKSWANGTSISLRAPRRRETARC